MMTLGKHEVGRAKEVDAQVINKFRFDWLETSVTLKSKKLNEIEVKLGDSIEKLDLSGKATCSYCTDVISYGGKDVKSAKHIF